MKKFTLIILLLILLSTLITGCDIDSKKTSITISDPNRHYYPIIRGQPLDVLYTIENTGKYPLVIKNIHTSCGCILVDESSFKMLPAGGKGFVRIKYDSSKNLGYVKHFVTIYANLKEGDKTEVTFDINIVPNALYTRDYEEIYTAKQNGLGKQLVDGEENNRGYYTDDPLW